MYIHTYIYTNIYTYVYESAVLKKKQGGLTFLLHLLSKPFPLLFLFSRKKQKKGRPRCHERSTCGTIGSLSLPREIQSRVWLPCED